MATGGDPVYTEETANGTRLQALLIDEGTKLVRKVFDQEVSRMNPHGSLQQHLTQAKNNLVNFLTPDQEKILYPTAGSAANSTQDFDITLLTLLLGRLCNMRPPHTGWSQEPPVGDKSPIAWIIRLKLFRNRNYGHIKDTALSNTKFKKLWKKLSDILRGLGGDQNKILRRKTETIDPEQAKMYQEKFERLHRQDNEVKDLLVAQGAQVAAQLSSLDENVQKQTSEVKKTRKELLHIERTHGKQQKQLSDKLSTLEEVQTNQSAKMEMTEKKTLYQLKTSFQQQQKAIIAEGHKQSEEIKTTVKESRSELKEEFEERERKHGQQHKQLSDKLSKQTAMLAEQKRQSAEMKITGQNTLQQMKTSVQQQRDLSEGQKAIIAEVQRQSEEIKTTVKESIEKQKPTVTEEVKTSAEGKKGTIDKLCNHLQGRYRRELARMKPLPWCEDFYLNLEQMFTTLEMVRRDGLKVDTAVIAEDMFKLHDEDELDPKTIRVEGDPGIGKTTLCYKIVYDCSAIKSKFVAPNKFSSFKLVLYVQMRQVRHDATDVKSTIFKQVFPQAYYKHEAEFWDYVESNPEDVLFVLDGLDEMPEETREQLEIVNFIRGQIIPDIHIIVTSRPYLCNRQLTSCDRHFVIKGYSHENIQSYIQKHKKLDSNSKDGMLKQLNENENLHQLTENPLNLALLCILWQEDWNNADLPQTLTGLYSLLVLAIVKRYAEKCLPEIKDVSNLKLEEMPEPIEGKLNQLSHLALNGIKEDRLNFSGETVESLVEIGFLTKDLNLTTTIQQSFWFEFLHKTFQEYFAARYLQSLCVTSNGEQSSNILNECVQNDRYQVLKFLAGLLGTNARCLFEAFHDCLSKKEDRRMVYLCLECLHECGAGRKLVKCVGDVLPRDWRVGQNIGVQDTTAREVISHLRTIGMYTDDEIMHTSSANLCVLSCKTCISSHEMRSEAYYIKSSEALYGLVHLFYHQAKQHSAQENSQLSNLHLKTRFDNPTSRFLRAVSSTKVFSYLSVLLDVNVDRHDDQVINEVCNLLQTDAYRDLTCDFKLYSYSCSSFDHLHKVLSSVQSETKLNLCSTAYVDRALNPTNEHAFLRVINKMVRLGRMKKDGKASIQLYIDCAADTYIPESVSSSLTNIVTTIKQLHVESSHYHGNLELVFIVRNLPLAEKPAVQTQVAKISSILENSYCSFSVIKFECSCEDGSVVSTMSLLQSLTLNKSLTEVSFLFDDPHNVAECLCHIFAKNKTLQELEIGFLHPVDDNTMANIFGSYPIDSPCHIKFFSVVMETGTFNNVSEQQSYEQTIRAILYICKNLCDGSALQKISFITGKVSKVTPICPGSLLKPLVEAIVNKSNPLIVHLHGMAWENITAIEVTPQERMKYSDSENFKKSHLGRAYKGGPIRNFFLTEEVE